MPAHVHAYRMGLYNGSPAITVDNETRETVSLAMDKAVCVVLGIVCDTGALSHGEGCCYAPLPERAVDSNVTEREDAHGYAAYLIVANSDEVPLGCQHTHDAALWYVIVGQLNRAREYPWVETSERLVLASLEAYIRICIGHRQIFW